MSLPDDVFLEIFPRVKDVAALFRCAAVCKQWRDLLLAKPSFLCRCLSEEACRSCPFAGFFTQQRRRNKGKDLPAPCFVPGPRPVLGNRGPLSSLVPGMGPLAVPLTSRHGLLLLRVGGLLMVCDPLAGTFKSLPHLHLDHHRWDSPSCFTGYAMLTAQDCSSSAEHNNNPLLAPFFKVMIIVVAKHPMHYDLHTYSAGDLGWKNVCSGTPGDMGQAIHVKLVQHSAVICGGSAHWFVRGTLAFYFIDACAKTGQFCGVRKLVDTTLHNLLNDSAYDEPYLSLDAEGRLAYLCLRTDGRRLDFRAGHNGGTHSHIMLEPPWSLHTSNLIERGGAHECLGEKNGRLIIKDNHHRIYVADFRTGVVQEITDFPRGHSLSRGEIVPLDIYWPD